MKFKFLSHTADVKFQAFGKTKEKAFVNSVMALKEVIAGKIKMSGEIRKELKVEGKDDEALLYNFLEEFLFLLDSENFLLRKIERIEIVKGKLNAEIVGDKATNYDFSNHVKAVTYNSMFVKKIKGEWVCQVVLDV